MGIRLGIGGLKIGQGSTGINWSSYWAQLNDAGKIDYRATGIESDGLSLTAPVGSGGSLKQLPCMSIARATNDIVSCDGTGGLLMTDANAIYEFYLETIIESHEANARGDIFSTNAFLGPNGWSFRSYGPGFYLEIKDTDGTYACNQIAGTYFVLGLNIIKITFNIPTKAVTVVINGASYAFTHNRANVFDLAPRNLSLGSAGANTKTQKPVYLKISKDDVITNEYVFGEAVKVQGNVLYRVFDTVGSVNFIASVAPQLAVQDLANPFKSGYDLFWNEDTMRYRDLTPKNVFGNSNNPNIIFRAAGSFPFFRSLEINDLGYHMLGYIEMPDLPIFDTTSRTYWKVETEADPYYVGGTAGRERWFHRTWLDFDWINTHIEDDYKGLFFVQCRWRKAVGDQYVKVKIENIVLLNEVQSRLSTRQDIYESVNLGRFYESGHAKSGNKTIYNILATLGDKRVALYGNYLLYSSDAGLTYNAGIDFSATYAVAGIKDVRIFKNGNIGIFSNTKLVHYSDDNLATVTLCTTLDVDGDPFVFTNDVGHYWNPLNPCVETDDVIVYGSYPTDFTTSPILWYSINGGQTWKAFYKYNEAEMLETDHIHGVNIGYDGNVYVSTGDVKSTLLKCVFNAGLETWTLTPLTNATTQTWQRMRGIGAYERNGYIYWGSDGKASFEFGGITYQSAGIYKSRIEDIDDPSKHILLSSPANDWPCLSFINSLVNGKVLSSHSASGGSPDGERHFSSDYGETWEVFPGLFKSNLIACTYNEDGDFWTGYRNIVLKYLV